MARAMWINGEHTTGVSSGGIKVLNPYTEEVLDVVPAGTPADVERAVDAAQAAFEEWCWVPAVERADFLHEIARKLRDNEDAIARQLTLEGGKPLVENLDEVAWTAACFDYYAELGRHSRGRVIPSIESSQLSLVLKEAFLGYGIPKRLYVDNGPSFSSQVLARSCALAGISLIHSKPYDSPSRGKVERLFRTIRERFLSGVQEGINLDELNEAFWLWLQEDYHNKFHAGIGETPIDRYSASVDRVPIRRLSKTELDEIFLIRHERVVNNDATISFKGAHYEVPAAYIRQRIEIRHPVLSTPIFL